MQHNLYTNYLICLMLGIAQGDSSCTKFINSIGQPSSDQRLTLNEAVFLNGDFLQKQFIPNQPTSTPFKFLPNQRIAFLHGNSFTQWTKEDYFRNVKEFNYGDFEEGVKVFSRADNLHVLTEKEKQESGGYDAILLSWSKVDMSYKREYVVKSLINPTQLLNNTNAGGGYWKKIFDNYIKKIV